MARPQVRARVLSVLILELCRRLRGSCGPVFVYKDQSRLITRYGKGCVQLHAGGVDTLVAQIYRAITVCSKRDSRIRRHSDQKVNATLRLMGRSPGDRLGEGVARDLCQRVASKAVLSGSIAVLGSQYVIGLNAINCSNGDSLANEQARATGKEQVLKALDQAASRLRAKLGESHSSVQKFDTPIVDATTPSLEALKAYSLGLKIFTTKETLINDRL